ncbi:hypothetical protein A3C86_01230 [Candidatus Kaiserbacteria bacterium RIFCSPHIGHO2_02_FULL_49_16]|uniref:Small-conductance mechanosensitive ion channel n=1 Tax=Candidatus Kaiserbacteria bacterium RIFCSPHIGHO2_02_FULL_49_16 TaxID=1798490 RepID=A0A1F6DCD2_9BACT|nr:MAG: hypothetical protein A3C86_01230 [Candidatus Kaiserbacteria bacterium RIFCSPHIGHO2_02_FULL_49_16]
MIVSQSASVVQTSLQNLWWVVVQYLPNILIAVVVFVIGWVVSIILYRVVEQIVKVLRVDDALRAAGVNEAAKNAGFNLDIGRFLATLVKWFVVIVFLMSALDILGLNRVITFLQQVVLLYLPQVIVAVIILIITAIVAELVKNLVAGSARATGAHAANLAGTVAKYAIWIFGILAALTQLNVASELVTTLFQGLVVAFALSFGLAFGLGGKEAAARTIERVRSEISHNN